jgi:hypothetical protein
MPDSEGGNSRNRTGFSLQAKRNISDKLSQIDQGKGEILNRYPFSMNFIPEYFKD